MTNCRRSKIYRACILIVLVLGMAGCASTQERKSLPVGELMRLGIQHAQNKQYKDASEKFKQLMDDYPDSPERIRALLLLADSHYNSQDYQESKLSYQRFIELYPAHQEVDRARYYKAMSDYNNLENASRDQTATRNAMDEFNTLIKNFPKSAYLKKAIKKRDECIERLAMNLIEIGKFYFRTGNYASAITRFQGELEQYPDQKFNDEALFFIAESYYMEQNYEKAGKTYEQFLQKYPKSKLAQNARDRLKSIRK